MFGMGDQETNDAPEEISAEDLVAAIEQDSGVESEDELRNLEELASLLDAISEAFVPLTNPPLENFSEQLDHITSSMLADFEMPPVAPVFFDEISEDFQTIAPPSILNFDEDLFISQPNISHAGQIGTPNQHTTRSNDLSTYPPANDHSGSNGTETEDSWEQFTAFRDTIATNLDSPGALPAATIATIFILYHTNPEWPVYAYLPVGFVIANLIIGTERQATRHIEK